FVLSVSYRPQPPPSPTLRSSDLHLEIVAQTVLHRADQILQAAGVQQREHQALALVEQAVVVAGHVHQLAEALAQLDVAPAPRPRSEEHTSELQSRENLVCRLLLE